MTIVAMIGHKGYLSSTHGLKADSISLAYPIRWVNRGLQIFDGHGTISLFHVFNRAY
jgi:hypothetical protein